MRFSATLLSTLFTGLALVHTTHALPNENTQLTRRTVSILNNPMAQPNLPSLEEVGKAKLGSKTLNLDNVQGDILVGMKKKTELFYFFQITDATKFKKHLPKDIHSRITTTTQLLDVKKQPATAVNVAFSQKGLNALTIVDSLADPAFSLGQAADADNLGDSGTDGWVTQFTGNNIHGVFLLASDTMDKINSELQVIQSILGDSIVEQYRLNGAARPGDQEGHEHFGYMDGIGQPGVEGFSKPVPGQTVIPAGMILLGENGDATTRPDWAKDGSFLAFRQLKQLVPEYDKFLTDNPLQVPGLSAAQGSALLGARLVGRWKSGAPVDLAPLFDDPTLAADPNRNNNFTYDHPGANLTSDQSRCPFSAHTRKTVPRADFNPVNIKNHIIRSGIPYGPEVTSQEAQSNTTTIERGLAFVAYQSDLSQGFRFIQQHWADNPNFKFGKNVTPGVDPLIGRDGSPRIVTGLDPTNFTRTFTLMDFVVSRGGEYFFAPSLSAIAGKLSQKSTILF